MALFRNGFDLEAGEHVAEPWNGAGVVQPLAPTLRHRAQSSQRFIIGKQSSQRFVVGKVMGSLRPQRLCAHGLMFSTEGAVQVPRVAALHGRQAPSLCSSSYV